MSCFAVRRESRLGQRVIAKSVWPKGTEANNMASRARLAIAAGQWSDRAGVSNVPNSVFK